MPHSADNSLVVRRAPAGQRQQALKLALSYLPPDDLVRHWQVWNAAIERQQAELWVGARNETLVAALLVDAPQGGTATVGLPRLAGGEPPETITTMLGEICNWLRQSKVRLAQVVPPQLTERQERSVVDAGFRPVCELLYLVCLRSAFPDAAPALDGVTLAPCGVAGEARLARVMERTYLGSLDCPQLVEHRSISEVLDGYRNVGGFDPALWLIAQSEGSDAGCLLLADHAESNAWELVYMGVVPEARGRGLGLSLVRHAQWLAFAAHRERLTTAADARNEPAVRAYAAAGFVGWDRRTVFLRALANCS